MPKLAVSDQAAGVVLPEDVYKVRITKLEPKEITWDNITKDVLEFTFEIQDDADYDGVEVRAIATLLEKLTPKSKLRAWSEAILGRKLSDGEEFDTDMLLDKSCRISTTVEEGKKGGTFTKVKDVMAARQPRPARTEPNGEDRY
jgi:hypothetical protein